MAIVPSQASVYEFTNVEDIDGNVDVYTMKVQVILMWKSFYINNPTVESSLDIVFEDEKGDRIFGTVKKALIKDFQKKFKEGSAYMISGFGVAANGGQFRVVNHKCKVTFHKGTIVEVANDFQDFGHYYRFVEYEAVLNRSLDMTTTFDAIVRLISSKDMRVFQASGKCVLNTRLQDLRGQIITCALWGEHANKMHSFIKENGCSDGPVIVLLQLAKFTIYDDAPQVSNSLYGSRLFINKEMQAIKEFKDTFVYLRQNTKWIHDFAKSSDDTCLCANCSLNRIGADSNSLDVVVQLSSNTKVSNDANYYNSFEFKNLDELSEITEPTGCVVVAKVHKIEHEQGWYYLKCQVCNSVATTNDDGAPHPFNCKDCGDVKDVYKKIRLTIRVQDDTNTVSLTLFEREVTKLVKISASALFAKTEKMGRNVLYPDEFKQLLDKIFVFKLNVTDFNLKSRWTAAL